MSALHLVVFAVAALGPTPSPATAGRVRVDGRNYVSVPEAVAAGAMRLVVDERAGIYTMTLNGRRVSLVPGFSVAEADGRVVALDYPANFRRGELLVPASLFFATAMAPAATCRARPGVERSPIHSVVLDAGHGGSDAGAVGPGGLREKDVTLSVALLLKGLLERQGVRVTLTRSADEFVPLLQRSAIANRSGADAFLSIHCNAARDNGADGAETFALSTGISDSYRAGQAAARLRPSDLVEGASDRVSASVEKAMLSAHLSEQRRQSLALAASLQAELVRALGETDRGMKLRNFSVLRETYIPAALAEIGFISHWPTERKLRSANYRWRVAEAMACGVSSYARSEAARLGRISGASRPGSAADTAAAPDRETAAGTRLAHRAQPAGR